MVLKKHNKQVHYKKVRVRSRIKYLHIDDSERQGILIKASGSELVIAGEHSFEAGHMTVACVNNTLRLRGVVQKVTPKGFLLKIHPTKNQLIALIEFLTCILAEKDNIPISADFFADRRGEIRKRLARNKNFLIRKDGSKIACELTDISLNGLGISTNASLEIGEELLLGQKKTMVAREHEQGYGLKII